MRLFFIWLFLIATLVAAARPKPNIVIIISDDHAYQAISAYGSKFIKTPAIDRIAKEGAIFNKAYVTNSICGPSRAVLLTGKYSHKNGFRDNAHSRFDGSQDSFIKQLRANGYLTAWIGKWHLESQPQGFDYWKILPGQGHYFNPDFLTMDGGKKRVEGYVSNIIEDETEDWLNKRDTSKPFCVVVGHKAAHRTWMPDTSDMGMLDKATFPLPHNFYDNYSGREAANVQDMTIAKTMVMGYDLKMFDKDEEANKDGNISRMNAAQRASFDRYYKPIEADLKARHLSGNSLTEWKYQRFMKDYLSTVASLDRNIGRTLDYLDQHNLTGNTIVIYMSDQGFYLGEHGWFDKRWMYEESMRTPMVMRYPGVVMPGTINNDLVMNLDVAPTVLEAAGVKIPGDIQGESMLPLLLKKNSGRRNLYYHYYENGEHAVSPHFGVKTKRYKLIRFYKRVNSWELYDLEKDPHEMHNVFGKIGYEKIAADLHRQLLLSVDKYDDRDAKQILAENKLAAIIENSTFSLSYYSKTQFNFKPLSGRLCHYLFP